MLTGKKAIVTGGSRGIGRAIAETLAKNGADVAILYVGAPTECDEVKETITAMGREVLAIPCDVSDFEAVGTAMQEVLEAFGKIDILVNNAGITRDGLLMRMKEEDWDAVLSVNLKSMFNTIRHASSAMVRARYGKIVNISSVSGMMGNPGQANYSAAKAGVIGLTKTVAKEFASRGITCNAIAPGFIETAMTAALSDKVKEAAAAEIPMGKMGEAQDIAEAALFLASDKSKYITGVTLKVDGGMYI